MPFSFLKEWVKKHNIKSKEQWFATQKPRHIPEDPSKFYQQWAGWYDFLGIKSPQREYVDFNTARNWARKLNLKSINDWIRITKHPNFPKNMPKSPWNQYIEARWTNWKGMPDFLGYEHPHGSALREQYRNTV